MANELAISASPRWRVEDLILEGAFLGFLLLVFVGLQPFAPRIPELLALGDAGSTGKGDMLRQVSYLGVFGIIALAALRKHGLGVVTLVPVALSLALLWCLMSALWATQGDVTMRRAGLEIVIVLSAILGVESLGIDRALKSLHLVLAIVLIVNWISVPLTPNAIHQPGEIDPGIVGAWRGLYFHKNIAGAVSALSALVFLHFALDRKSRIDWLLFLGAAAFTVMTQSKSSMGLLLPAILGGAVYRMAWKRGLDRGIAAIAALLAAGLGTTFLVVDWQSLARLVNDPMAFTGRTAIWAGEVAYIADHPVLGGGYGSFSNTGGAASPLQYYVAAQWVRTISQGHNGYLQVGMEIELVGAALVFAAVVIQPAITFWRRDFIPLAFKAFLFSLFVFMVLHNAIESDFLNGDGPVWVILLMTVAMLRRAHADMRTAA